MDVCATVTSRRAVRGFTDRHVPKAVHERVLSAAAWAPSGSNLQPWHVYVLTGRPLTELKKRVGERVGANDPWDEPEPEMYPPALKSPYRERRFAFGEQHYGALGIPREDIEARQRAASANWVCFGAPAALFCYIDRGMGRPQWSDVGMYLQTVMLLLRTEGLHSCTQMAWAKYHKTVAEVGRVLEGDLRTGRLQVGPGTGQIPLPYGDVREHRACQRHRPHDLQLLRHRRTGLRLDDRVVQRAALEQGAGPLRMPVRERPPETQGLRLLLPLAQTLLAVVETIRGGRDRAQPETGQPGRPRPEAVRLGIGTTPRLLGDPEGTRPCALG